MNAAAEKTHHTSTASNTLVRKAFLQRTAEPQFFGNPTGFFARRGGFIQPKLSVSQRDDPYEREADRVADQVMQMPEPTLAPANTPIPEPGGEEL
jgi:hypothetical protein